MNPGSPLTPFGQILRAAVEATPGAVGGAFADSQGELVDSFATWDRHEWAVLTAHYGVVMAQLSACYGTWHYGGPEYFIAQHAQLDVVVWALESGYYVLLGVTEPGAPLARALESLRQAAVAITREMA